MNSAGSVTRVIQHREVIDRIARVYVDLDTHESELAGTMVEDAAFRMCGNAGRWYTAHLNEDARRSHESRLERRTRFHIPPLDPDSQASTA